jgi:hypothetical protein
LFYNILRNELLIFRKPLIKFLDKGFIQVNYSPVTVLVLFAKKPRGGLCFCIDYRGLNQLTKKDCYFLPLIHKTSRNIAKAKWFTKLDVATAFHKIRIAEGRVSNGVPWDPVKRDGIWIPIWDIPRGPVPSQIGPVY